MNDILKLADDPQRKAYIEAGIWGTSVTLDNLFARNLRRAPDKVILCDPPNKAELMNCAPLVLTASEAERIIDALCTRFTDLGLKEGQVIGLQLPNTVELPLTLLACFRSGLVPALLPLLWSERDIIAALDTLNVQALISVTICGTLLPADKLRYASASLFSVRYLMAFGSNMPDGVLGLNDVYDARLSGKVQSRNFSGRADSAALITFRFTSHGPAPVIRNHNQAMSAALMTLLEGQMEPDKEIILSTLQPTSLAGLATGFLPWLLSSGKLVLHQSGSFDLLAQQIDKEKVTCVTVPAAIVPALVDNKEIPKTLKAIISMQASAAARPIMITEAISCSIIDAYALDEFGFVVRARGEDAQPTPLHLGPQIAPSFGIGPALIELGLSVASHLTVCGPSVPFNKDSKQGVQQTGYIAAMAGSVLKITGRADQVAFIGGLAVSMDEVASVILRMEGIEAVQIKAVPDPIFGEMLEARIHFERSPLSQEQRIERLKQELSNSQIAAYKIPARFVIDPMITTQKNTVLRTENKKAV